MAGALHTWPVWALVLLGGALAQLAKLLIYSAARRRPSLDVLGQSVGLPSLHAVVLTSLTVLMVLRVGWQATESALCLVFSAIVIHDAMRLKGAAHEQKLALYELTRAFPEAGAWQRHVLDILNTRAHQPLHVGMGVLFGLFFALATGPLPD